jgi:hypothetical protein
MNKKTGKAGSPVEPLAPVAANEADVADPGEVTEIKARQRQTKSGKYGSTKAKPFKSPAEDSNAAASDSEREQAEDEKKSSWIEIEMIGEDDKPIAGEKYQITLPDGTVDEGTLDQNGWARVDGFEEGSCKITFPKLDQKAWEFIESKGAREGKP